MEITAQLSNARVAPRKVRGLRTVIVGLPVVEAMAQLNWQGSEAAGMVAGVLGSALANAQHNHEIEATNLRVADLRVNEGMRFKRWRPASRGMSHPFVKLTSHVTVVLDEVGPKGETREHREKKSRRSGRQSRSGQERANIETVTVDELAQREEKEKVKGGPGKGYVPGGKMMESYQKTKMQLRGGDKKRTYRRKSI